MVKKYIHDKVVHNTRAAEFLVPEIIKCYNPKSVVDVGCGIGTWLHTFQKYGIDNILGIDGDYVDHELLMIQSDKFVPADLNLPYTLNRRFDLAMSLEVAEHLFINSASNFVQSLTKLSDLIIFSAAIPGQGGQNHLNEQYPDYWLDLFMKEGYKLINDFSSILWNKNEVEWWYRQNILVFKKSPTLEEVKQLQFSVHPELYKLKLSEIEKLEFQLKTLQFGNTSIYNGLRIFLKSIYYSLRK